MDIKHSAQTARSASILLSAVKTGQKNKALLEIAKAIESRSGDIVEANRKDLAAAAKNGLAEPLLKRLTFDEKKIAEVCMGVKSLIKLDDPAGRTISITELDKGLMLYKTSCPIGVIGVVFESRPDALVQISTLCLKSGNAVLLKGGSEAEHTNEILAEVISGAAEKTGLPKGWLVLMHGREDVRGMLKLDGLIDLIIPRGSNEFVRYIMDNTNIPVMGHADGICHVYVDGRADMAMALKVLIDSKCQYVAVCNAAESLLVDKRIAARFLPAAQKTLVENGVEIRGCAGTRKMLKAVKAAGDRDFGTEYLDYIISVKVVDGVEEAVEHINRYGSHHTDTIVTADRKTAVRFMESVDSASVFWNCSTRFSDGFRYGLGAEVGISTNKIHARGPVGLEGLVIYKWKLTGKGHIVADYAEGRKKFKHKKI